MSNHTARDIEIALDVAFLSHLQDLHIVEHAPITLPKALAGMRLLLPDLPPNDLRASLARLVRRGHLARTGNTLWVNLEALTMDADDLFRLSYN